MTTYQDCSVGVGVESTYGTGVTPVRWYEFLEESLDFTKNTKQGGGLRVGSRVGRSGRRVVTTADAGGDFSLEALSKGMGLLWQACLGAGTSTLVGGTTYQQVFTLADTLPSLTVQKGIPLVDGTVKPYTFLGAQVDSWELTAGNDAIAQLKMTLDAKDVTPLTAYAAPSYAAGGNLLHFANGAIASGVLTAPTATALAAGATPLAQVRSANVKVSNNQATDRYNFGAGGRKAKPTVGLREIAGGLEVEYTDDTFRDAVLNDTPMSIVLTYQGGALSTGLETLQIVIPEVKFDGKLPSSNGGQLITVPTEFVGLDNLTAAQPIWVVVRTSDTAL